MKKNKLILIALSLLVTGTQVQPTCLEKARLIAKLAATGLIAGTGVGLGYINYLYSNNEPKELHWDWSKIDVKNIKFPDHFKFCAATAEYQVSGSECFYEGEKRKDCPNLNWDKFERENGLEQAGRGIDHWNRYKDDVSLIKNLDVSVYRCSIEWGRVQPREGYFDQDAINHYRDLFAELKAQGLTPMVTLLHFTKPLWFENKGGFEKPWNIKYFVRFAERMFKEFGSLVPYWCTINEPGVEAAQAYIMHDFPRPEKSSLLGFPCNVGRGMCPQGAALVTKHLMMAHSAVYRAIKSMPGGDKAQVGIVHNIIHFEPYNPGNGLETALTKLLGHVYCDAITQFLTTGKLEFGTFTDWVTYENPNIIHEQDFVGLNYYSHVLLKWSNLSGPQFRPEDDEEPTDMYYGGYAEGIYRAINTLSVIGKPIYITENGLAYARDGQETKDQVNLRTQWYQRYLYAISRAIQEGADVRMFCAWSSFDNFEWNLGYGKKFGLYDVDRKTFERTLKPGAEYFREVAHKHANMTYAPLAKQSAKQSDFDASKQTTDKEL